MGEARRASGRRRAHLGLRVDVAEVRGDAGRVAHVVEREVRDRVDVLEKERERLADAARGAEHGDLDGLRGRGMDFGGRFEALLRLKV